MQNAVQPTVIPPQTQTLQVPGQAGVNIQIFNPTVGTPGSNYNVNAPAYNMGGGYPSGYYTNNWGAQGVQNAPNTAPSGVSNPIQAAPTATSTNQNTTTTNINETKNTTETTDKKTEKRKIVELTDDYIKNLENYLNSQDIEVRLMGAKEVSARFSEDESRKDDQALNALVNKMIQDPSTKVRALGLALLDSRLASGDSTSVSILKNMQGATTGYGQDARQATDILLKMSGKQIEKEFEVKDNKKKEEKK